jgi:hypothetical protein
MENTRIAWFAAIIEAEGTISCQVYTKPDGNVRITPYVCVSNTDMGILNECVEIFEHLTAHIRATVRWCSHAGTNKPCYTLRLDGPGIAPVLVAMLPFMRSDKKRNAATMLEYIESRSRRLVKRDALGRILRLGYSSEEVRLISSVRTHNSAKSFEAICEAPNVAA